MMEMSLWENYFNVNPQNLGFIHFINPFLLHRISENIKTRRNAVSKLHISHSTTHI